MKIASTTKLLQFPLVFGEGNVTFLSIIIRAFCNIVDSNYRLQLKERVKQILRLLALQGLLPQFAVTVPNTKEEKHWPNYKEKARHLKRKLSVVRPLPTTQASIGQYT